MDYGTLTDALAKWDEGKPCWTIEMGGLGPGYEQCIQIGAFELAKRLQGETLPLDDDKAFNKLLDDKLHALMKEIAPVLDGLSGAQAGAIKSLAYNFVHAGYNETLHQVESDRRIQASRNFPAFA